MTGTMRSAVVLAFSTAVVAQYGQPNMTLQFYSEMHVGQGLGHDGDGCRLAEQMLLETPVVSKIWFDKPGQRLAQTNPDLYFTDPNPNASYVGLYAEDPPTEIDVYPDVCYTEPLPPGFCKNGTIGCPPTFGDFGFGHST